ncbi:MAG: hypothetical protein LBC85_04500 [Fibromonadaceae bacterium]|jgi:V/A-type H+-transporting ATPase subunit K|nr:hypothetical protein [Fibromonadaceae bacterium]
MDVQTMTSLGLVGAAAAIGLSTVGSSIGMGFTGPAALGAWKKAYAQGKSAIFSIMVFVGCPLSQTIYGFILMNAIAGKVAESPEAWVTYLGAGAFGGLSIGVSSWFQAVICASAIDTVCETGKGFANGLMVMGIAETISLFVLVFIMTGIL